MVVNVCQLATQTQAKQEIKKTFKGANVIRSLFSNFQKHLLIKFRQVVNASSVKNEYVLSFLGSLVSGFVTACVSLPVDMAKTRTQNMKVFNKYKFHLWNSLSFKKPKNTGDEALQKIIRIKITWDKSLTIKYKHVYITVRITTWVAFGELGRSSEAKIIKMLLLDWSRPTYMAKRTAS